jgi:hypothetical protein
MAQRFGRRRVAAGIDGIGQTFELRGESAAFIVDPGTRTAVTAPEREARRTGEEEKTLPHTASGVRARSILPC